MKLNSLPKLTAKTKKIIGRGIGSGRGKTSTRGSKGQKARGKVPASFVGDILPLYKKLPYKRGLNRSGGNPKRTPKPVLVKSDVLNRFQATDEITAQFLIDQKVVSEKDLKKRGIKILNQNGMSKKLKLNVPSSKSVLAVSGGEIVS